MKEFTYYVHQSQDIFLCFLFAMKLHHRTISGCHYFYVFWLGFDHFRELHIRQGDCTCETNGDHLPMKTAIYLLDKAVGSVSMYVR